MNVRKAPAALDRPILALDAMGVLYAAGDDIADLLIPFAHGKGSPASADAIERAYLAASCGQMDAASFWRQIGLDPALEDEYLAGHRLVDGVHKLLAAAGSVFVAVCCISNDVVAWSIKLRRALGIETMIAPWLISSDLGVRKPDAAIYQAALTRLAVPAHRIFFVDDRVKNLDAARRLGISTILFDPAGGGGCADHVRIGRLGDLLDPAVLDRVSSKMV